MKNGKVKHGLILRALLISGALSLAAVGQSPQSEVGKDVANSIRPPALIVEAGPPLVIHSVAFSPDDKYVLVGGWDRRARLWEVETGREIRRFDGPSGYSWWVAFSPDGKRILTGNRDGTARFWDVETGEELRQFQTDSDPVWTVGFSLDGKRAVGGSLSGAIRVWDVETGKVIRRFQGSSEGMTSAAISPDGKLVVADAREIAYLWDVETGKELQRFEGHTEPIWSVAFSPDNRSVLTGGDDMTARLWDINTGKVLRRFEGHTKNIVSVAFSPSGGEILTGSQDGTARIWDAASGKELRRLEGHSTIGGVWSVAYSHSGKFVVTGGFDKTVRVWKAETGEEIRQFAGFANIILSAKFSTDGKYVLAGGLGFGTSLWELGTGREIRRFPGTNSWSVAISHDGKYVLTGGENNAAYLWDPQSGLEVRQLIGHTGNVISVTFSQDGKYALTGSQDKTARLWDVETGKELRRFETDSDVKSAAISPNGRYVLTGSFKGVVFLWNIETGKELRRLEGHSQGVEAVAFSPDGRFALTGSGDRTARLWDVETGKELRRFEGKLGHIDTIAFSPQGEYVLTGDDEEAVVLWDVGTGKELRRFYGHSGTVGSVAFSPDGKFVLTGGIDSTTRLWDLSMGKEFCKLISFTDDNWIVVAENGRFDASNLEALRGVHWVLPDDPMRPLPIEIFMRDYYEPRLLPRLIDDIPDKAQFKSVKSVANLNRVQPNVKITDARFVRGSLDTVSVTVEVSKAVSERSRGNHDLDETGVFDLRLFRDGQLAGYWPTPNDRLEPPTSDNNVPGQLRADLQLQIWRRDAEIRLVNGKFTKTFIVKLPHRQDLGQVTFTAYAFNRDRVRSAVSEKKFPILYSLSHRKGKAYVISVGVDQYEVAVPDFDLSNAVRDADTTSEQLYESLMRTGDFTDAVRIKLVSSRAVTTATKAIIRAVFEVLSGKIQVGDLKRMIPNVEALIPDIDKLAQANPDDVVIISFAGHGQNHEGTYFLVPYDTGPEWDVAEMLKHSISSDELAQWLMGVDAGDLLMVIDACNSGAATGPDFKAGPIDSRGLGQLAYDKGMKILVATQADSLAVEVTAKVDGAVISGGLLTHVLVEEGLKERKAGPDGPITGRSWMEYAVREVPKVYKRLMEILKARTGTDGTAQNQIRRVPLNREGTRDINLVFRAVDINQNSSAQQPMMFDFTRRRKEVVLSRF